MSENGSNSRHHVVNYFNNLESFRMIVKYNYLMNKLINTCKLISVANNSFYKLIDPICTISYLSHLYRAQGMKMLMRPVIMLKIKKM